MTYYLWTGIQVNILTVRKGPKINLPRCHVCELVSPCGPQTSLKILRFNSDFFFKNILLI